MEEAIGQGLAGRVANKDIECCQVMQATVLLDIPIFKRNYVNLYFPCDITVLKEQCILVDA